MWEIVQGSLKSTSGVILALQSTKSSCGGHELGIYEVLASYCMVQRFLVLLFCCS